MRILVTGATGFVGSHLVESLVHSGHTVTSLARKTSSLKWLEGTDYVLKHASLDDTNSLRPAVEGQEIVIHCAGAVRARSRDEFFRVNAQGTANLAQATVEAAPGLKQFILISSQAAVGPSGGGTPIDETTEPHPIDTYGKSKLQGEIELKKFADALPITIIRPSAIYGPRDRDIFQVFQAIHRRLRPVVGCGRRRLSLCHVTDIVQVITLACGNEKALGQTYMASNDTPADWREITATIAKAMDRRAVLFPLPSPLLLVLAAGNELLGKWTGRPKTFDREKAHVMMAEDWRCDVSKAMGELGYTPRIGLLHGAKETYAWYRSNGWL